MIQNWKRILTLFVSSLALLTTAQSCTIPGLNPQTNTSSSTVLGVLKKGDPKIENKNFVKANAVKQLDGNINRDGLTGISGVKILASDSDNLFLLTQQKGLFKSSEGGRIWERKYIFKVGSNSENQADKNREINAQIARNDALTVYDFTIDSKDKNVIYVAAIESKFGKIYKSIDGGENFNEVYTEVQTGIPVLFVTTDPQNPLRVYAVLQGGGLLRSLDGGNTWQKIRSFKQTPIQIGFVPEFNNLMYILFPSDGLAYSYNDGQDWETQNLVKADSQIGENQPKDGLDVGLSSRAKFGKFEKVSPVIGPDIKTPSWIVMADKQIWYGLNGQKELTKLVLPLQSEQYNLLDVATDPTKGIEKIYVSVDDKLFESQNKGQSWSTNDQINFKNGNIGQILVDKNDTKIVYLMLVDAKSRRNSGLLG